MALHAPAGAPPGLRGTFAIAASRAPGVTISTRSRFDAHADTELLEDRAGNYRASLYLRPLAIWAIEEAIERSHAGAS